MLLLAGFAAMLLTAAFSGERLLAVFAAALSTGALRVERLSLAVATALTRGAFLTLGRAVFAEGFGLADAFALVTGMRDDLVVADALGRRSLATTRVGERFFAAMMFPLFRILVDDNGAAFGSSRVCGCSDAVLAAAKF